MLRRLAIALFVAATVVGVVAPSAAVAQSPWTGFWCDTPDEGPVFIDFETYGGPGGAVRECRARGGRLLGPGN